mgnify:CR=1 FL=1|tara:strand:+ start:198 stop:548 length:351 start_codon:yes stop_codon:yes gene_type:complete
MFDKILKIDDIEGKVYELENWKPSNAVQVKKYFTEKSNELKNEYKKLVEDFTLNKIIFECEMNFKPVLGKKYYLYQNKDNINFMSLISPQEWKNNDNLKFLGVFKQDTHQKWVKVD